MQLTPEIDDIGISPSFSCYSNGSLTSMAATKVSREELQEFSNGDEEDFEFSFDFTGEEYSHSPKEHSLAGRISFPIFNIDLTTNDAVNRVVEEVVHDNSSVIISLEKLFVGDGDGEDELVSSSSEAEDPEDRYSRTFCVSWRKAGVGIGSPTTLADCKKSRSTGSRSRRWRIKDIFRRSNSAGKEIVLFLCPKKVDASKHVKSDEVRKVAGKSETASFQSVHELFYVQKKAEQKGDKMKSYLPYRKDLFGFYVNVNGNRNKKLPI